MNKTITAALLILISGLTLSTTALAEPFNHGSSYADAISNAYSNPHTPSAQVIRRTETVATIGGFNDRSAVENENVVASPRTAVETSNSGMLSIISGGFNDRS